MNRKLQVRTLDEQSMQAWDSYLDAHPAGTFFHRAGWKKVLEKAFGHKAHYLYAINESGQIEGIFPVGEVSSLLFGHSLISVPFCVFGGILANGPAARSMLLQAAMQLARDLNVDYMEVRNPEPLGVGWETKSLYVNFCKEIEPEPEKNMLAIPRKQRAMVRKGINAGLRSVVDSTMDRFYEAYAESVRNLGTPVFSRHYFRVLQEVFTDECEILTVTRDDHLVASVMSFYFRDKVLPYYGGGTAEARAVKGNDFMYWEVMRRACEKGVRIFDYGRSKEGTGSYSFKKNWGFEPESLDYQYYLVKARRMPDISPLNPKYSLFIRVWKQLPLPITKIIGPLVAKNLA
jgi:FemAB-related protein (PEP-CTERM system-associated)